MIKHVSFDLWLTLIKSNPSFKKERAKLIADFFDIKKQEDIVLSRVRYFDKLANSINEIVGKNIDCYEIILLILHDLEVDISKIHQKDLDAFYAEMEKLIFNFLPELLEKNTTHLLNELKELNLTLSLLSNTGFIRGKTLDKILKELNIYNCFSFRLYSDELGYSKPYINVFDAVEKKVLELYPKIKRKEILHIGDNPKADYEGATDYGFSALLINNHNSRLAHLIKEISSNISEV